MSELQDQIIQEQLEIQRIKEEVQLATTGTSEMQQVRAQNEALNASFVQHLKDGLQDNALYRGIQFGVRNTMFEDDPNFVPSRDAKHLLDELQPEFHDPVLQSGSMAEATVAAMDARETQEARQRMELSSGVTPTIAHLIAGMADVDTIAMLPMTIGKGVLAGAKAGAIATGIDTSVLAATAPEYHAGNVPTAMLAGAAFGGTVGLVTKDSAKMQDTLNAHGEEMLKKNPEGTNVIWDGLHPDNIANNSSRFSSRAEELSVGAMESPDSTLYVKDFSLHPVVRGYMQAAEERISTLDIPSNPFKQDKLSARLGEMIYNIHGKTPLASPFQQLWESDSDVAKVFAYDALESNVGVVRNNTSAAMLTPYYRNQLASVVTTDYDNLFLQYIKDTHGKSFNNQVTQSVASVLMSDSSKREFNKQVISELQARLYDGPAYVPNPNKAVQTLAQNITNGFKLAYKIGLGLDGQTALKGIKELDPNKMGWFQKWDGNMMNKLMMERKVSQKQIIETLKKAYAAQYPDLDPRYHKNMAVAVVRRAEMNRLSGDTNLYRMLNEEGMDYAVNFLTEAGISETEAIKMMDALKGKTGDAGAPSVLRHRMDIDLRTPIEGTGLTLMDLVDTDILKAWGNYSNRMGGLSALARKDIQFSDRKSLIDAIVISSNGKVTKDYMENIFNAFTGDPIKGGVHPDLHRALTATYLSTLNNAGLIQTMEYAPLMASTTLDNFFKSVKVAAKAQAGGSFPKLMRDIGRYLPSIYGEQTLFRPELFLEEISKTPSAMNPFREFVDRMLQKGVGLQKITNGMAMVMNNQHAAGVHALLHDLNDVFRNMKTRWTRERLYDIGIDDALHARLKKYWDTGVVEQMPGGDINLNLEQWKAADREELSLALLRNSMQMVQREAIGESPQIYGGSMGAFLFALKKFTLGSITKQTVRALKHGDMQALMGFIYGTGLAGGIYTGSQMLKGKGDKVNLKDSALGALSYAGQTGWIPMMYDPFAVAVGNPIANLAGYDVDLTLGKGGGKGLQQDVLATPTVLTVGNRLLRLPTAVPRVLAGKADSQDRAAIATLPLIGNHTFFAGAINTLANSKD